MLYNHTWGITSSDISIPEMFTTYYRYQHLPQQSSVGGAVIINHNYSCINADAGFLLMFGWIRDIQSITLKLYTVLRWKIGSADFPWISIHPPINTWPRAVTVPEHVRGRLHVWQGVHTPTYSVPTRYNIGPNIFQHSEACKLKCFWCWFILLWDGIGHNWATAPVKT